MYHVPVSIFNHQKRPRQALYADPQAQGAMNKQTNVQPQNKLPGSTVYPPKPQEKGRGRGGPSPQSQYQNGQSPSTFQSQGQNAQTQTWKRTPQNVSQVFTSKNTQQLPIQSQINVSGRKRLNETPQNNKFGQSINSHNLQQRSGGTSAQRALKFGGDILHNPTLPAGAPAPSLHSSAKRPNKYNTTSLVNLPNPAIASFPTESKNSVKLEKSVEEKITLNKDLHVITATVAGVKKWSKYKEQVPLIFEVFGVVDSALVKDSSGMAKEFLLRDEQESMQCIFYEITEITSLTSSSPERLLRRRGRMRHRTRGGRGRKHAVQPENRADQALHIAQTRQTRMREIITNVEPDRLRELFIQMLQFHPSLVFNVLEPGSRQCGGYHPSPDIGLPDWCVWVENAWRCPHTWKRCERQNCISLLPDFQVLILDEAVHALARMYQQDVLVLDDEVDLMSANRHAAYRQFILWQHRRLGSGQRCCIPSCCVWQICDEYPDAFEHYTSFIPLGLPELFFKTLLTGTNLYINEYIII